MTKRQKRTLVRIILSGVLLVAAYLLPLEGWWRLPAFAVPYLLVGWDVLWGAVRNIGHGQIFDENFLMSIATIGAFALQEFPEAVFVMLFYQVGELFQSYAVGKSRRSISQLMDICPDYANIRREGELVQVEPDEVQIGDIIVVKPGEKVPLDGVVVSGSSSLDTAALTGESLPRSIAEGDDVVSGCVNLEGLLEVRVTKEFGQSTVSKILELVENSASKKAKTENFITKFARFYTPCVVGAAVLLAVLPPLLFGGEWSEWIERALIFLVISCPCALVISVPLSFFGGIGGASRLGILIKGGNYFEVLAKAETVVFDKTGTLTKGVFRVTALHPENCTKEQLIETAALAESYSDHPIARSVKEAYGKTTEQSRVADVKELAGRGISAVIDGKTVLAGNDKLMKEAGVVCHACHKVGTAVHVAAEGVYLGHIVISDEVKEDAKAAIGLLKAAGVNKTVMLTGDETAVGEAVAQELGLDEAYTKLLPADKVERVEALLNGKKSGSLLFVGDGINDAPVLSRADVGVAMGGMGSDAAIEAADVVLMDDKPSKIAAAVKIAKKTMRIVRQNIVFALVVKFVVLALGALGLANMWAAVFADVGVSVLAVLNAMRTMAGVKADK
ncbi:MAG: cadmium-translocating P-type ATPase [Oscillospiraceae bacterium]|nr:cadmium-translocating P-type ATPase [Oscillospiraceae bacterium]